MMAENRFWYVVMVRPGFVSLVAAQLDAQAIPVFPSEDQTPNDSFGTEPFSSASFLFARFSLEAIPAVLMLPGVLCIAGVPKPLAVDEQDIEDLHAAIWARLPMTVLTDLGALQAGRVLSGPLRGRIGLFVESDGEWHLAIRVAPLEQTFAFAIPASSVVLARRAHAR